MADKIIASRPIYGVFYDNIRRAYPKLTYSLKLAEKGPDFAFFLPVTEILEYELLFSYI